MTRIPESFSPTLADLCERLGMDPSGSSVDPQLIDRIVTLREEGRAYHQIATILTIQGWPTERGGRWSSSTVRGLLLKYGPTYLAAQEVTKQVYTDEMLASIDAALARPEAGS